MKPTIPFSMSQTSQMRAFPDMRDLDEWINSLLEIREGAAPYCLHIDHLSILPRPKGTGYQALRVKLARTKSLETFQQPAQDQRRKLGL